MSTDEKTKTLTKELADLSAQAFLGRVTARLRYFFTCFDQDRDVEIIGLNHAGIKWELSKNRKYMVLVLDLGEVKPDGQEEIIP